MKKKKEKKSKWQLQIKKILKAYHKKWNAFGERING
jgi:uncharacterized protein YcnI